MSPASTLFRLALAATSVSLLCAQPLRANISAAARDVTRDIAAHDKAASPLPNGLVWYTVPAMSNLKRTHQTYPSDGTLGAPVRIIAAKGEYEPASIVLYADKDAKKVELSVSDLTGKKGKIPSSAVDVKVVKVWVQTGTGWYSYFADSKGRTYVPELLLNDETLVTVDRDTMDNYLRVDYPKPRGAEYVWISHSHRINVPFNEHAEPFGDAEKLQPFALTKGEFKQIWFTLEAPKEAEGLYEGTITIKVDGTERGKIPLQVRVLPFELPDPKTHYDLEKEYYTAIYHQSSLLNYYRDSGRNLKQVSQRLYHEFVSMRKHNIHYPILENYVLGQDEIFSELLSLYKKAGLKSDVIFGGIPAIPSNEWLSSPEVRGKPLSEQPAPLELYQRVDKSKALIEAAFGHHHVYAFGWDEPTMPYLVAERLPWKYIQDQGVKIYTTGHDGHLLYGGYNEDFINYGGRYNAETSAKWHSVGTRITNYAAPHTGPENPDFVRRTHGLDNYKADCDGINNYMLNGSPWNDFIGTDYNFRAFNLMYTTQLRPIDTIQYEGLREAIDDVRYATLMKQLAWKAIETGKTENIYQGRLALLWLANLDPKMCNLNAARLEMIAYILKLQNLH